MNHHIELPSGIDIPNISVSSFFSETAEVLARKEPSLLLAEDAGGTVLLALADMDGGLLGERQGEVEISLDSTAVALVGIAAGIAIPDMHSLLARIIQDYPQFPGLTDRLRWRLGTDKNFLDRLYDDPETVRLIQVVAQDIARQLGQRFEPQSVLVMDHLTSSRARSQGWQTCGDVANHRWSDEPICPRGWDCESFVPNDYATRAECEQGAREWRGGGDMGEEQRDCGVDLGSVAGSACCATARASQEAVCDDDYDLCLRNCTIITDEECGPFYCLRTVKGPCDVVVSNNHQACLETYTHYCDGVPLPIEIPCDP